MDKQTANILWFEHIGIEDVPLVGGKNAALGEMISSLVPLGVQVPGGYAITASSYREFLSSNGLDTKILKILEGLDTHNLRNLQKRGQQIRRLILKARLPKQLEQDILSTYRELEKRYGRGVGVAVRSSATAEDLPTASFAGQQETYLNITGKRQLLRAVKRCYASLFTDRAISYRVDQGFDHSKVALSVGVQKMVRSDIGASGIMFSIDTETGYEQVVVINATYGLGEIIVGGGVIPDEFLVFKPLLEIGKLGIISRQIGEKASKIIYSRQGTKKVPVALDDRQKLSISDTEVTKLAKWAVSIEKHFSRVRGHLQPMDMEWAKDGTSGELFVVQARPETVHSAKDKNVYTEYRLKGKGHLLAEGTAVGTKIASGHAHVIKSPKQIGKFRSGEVLVTEVTDPDWEPIMKMASAIVTDKGGRTSHAAIVSRELGIPAVVGTHNGTRALAKVGAVTVDCSSGKEAAIYGGKLKFDTVEHRLDKLPETKTHIMVNIGAPDEAMLNHYLPVKGVGLGRLEFIIVSGIQIHPNALIDYAQLHRSPHANHNRLAARIAELTAGYEDKRQYYIDKLAEGVAKIGAAFWPQPVIIRFSDFKTNEYRTLIGGELYEPEEANPMIGWRGASRYYDPRFKEAFGLECQAIKKVRREIGLTNVVTMVPFCRTPEEGRKVLDVMASAGLDRKNDKDLKVYVMCEIPSNVIRADEFLDLFDGMSIGSNDLSQLVLGIDRDSSTVKTEANEQDLAVKEMVKTVIKRAKARNKYIGICGQAPSDFPDFAQFLVTCGIDSISLNPDTVVRTLPLIAKAEASRPTHTKRRRLQVLEG